MFASTTAALHYRVRARNLSRESENRIHEDSVARRFGFMGALVPGVEVHAYACRPAVARWGRDWLERGTMESRFLKPVYDAAAVEVAAEPEGDAALAIRVESGGVLCATTTATLPAAAPAGPAVADYPRGTPPAERPPASEGTLAPGAALCTAPQRMTPEVADAYLRGVAETEPVYAAEGIVHPGLILRLCNRALTENVVLGPWVHVGSAVLHLSAGRVGEALEARARVVSNADRKEHGMVELDCLVVADGVRPVAHVRHTAIWRLRGA